MERHVSKILAGRINSWKEIAIFFGRDQRTVKRWEARRNLPVYRVPGGGKTTVYAYVSELEAWLKHDTSGDIGAPDADADVVGAGGAILASQHRHRSFSPGIIAFLRGPWGLGVVATVLLGVATWWISMPIERVHTVNPVAYSFYVKGLYSWQTRTPAGLRQSIDDFNKSIKADAHFAPAYAGLADSYNLMSEYTNMPRSIAFPRAKKAAERAIELDDRLAAAHRALAFVHFWWLHDVSAAMREFKRALALDPHASQTHHWYANALGMTGNSRAALAEISYAEDLAPGSTAVLADKGILLVDAGRFDEAVQILKQVETAQPDFAPAHAYLAIVYRFLNDGPAALREMRIQAELKGDASGLAIVAAGEQGFKTGGIPAMRQQIARKEQELVDQGKFSPYLLAVTYSEAGDRSHVLSLLSRAVKQRDTLAMAIRIEPAFQKLHSDPQFAALVASEGLSVLSKM